MDDKANSDKSSQDSFRIKAEEVIKNFNGHDPNCRDVCVAEVIEQALSEARKDAYASGLAEGKALAAKEILESSEVVGLREFIETDCLCGPAEAPCKACWLKYNFDTLKSKHQEKGE